jgi:lauroyl/myristoyl acyltransferase
MHQTKFQRNIPGTKSDGTKQFIKAAMNKKNIAVMVDQSITQGKKINFFNNDAYTTLIPSQLFLKYNYQIIPLHIERINNHQF